MESTSDTMRIHMSEASRELLVHIGGYHMERRGLIKVKVVACHTPEHILVLILHYFSFTLINILLFVYFITLPVDTLSSGLSVCNRAKETCALIGCSARINQEAACKEKKKC